MKHLRYAGEFLSHAGVAWQAEIWQEAEQAFGTIGALTFEADSPIEIEWPEKGRHESLCGSSATIRIESPGDRTYEDLYSIDPGRVRLDVYRNGVLYWSGCLDPEFYEEPYEKACHYPVALTFSDLGILSRKKYNLSGFRTLREIIAHCLQQGELNFGALISNISLRNPDTDEPMDLDSISVRSDNFFDEDGEASSLADVLAGILQPLGLRLQQHFGNFHVYDVQALDAGATQAAQWSADSSTLSTDVVYNNVVITWSPYAQSGNLYPEECWTTPINESLIGGLNSPYFRRYKDSDDVGYAAVHHTNASAQWQDSTDVGFTIWRSVFGENISISESAANAGVDFFKIVPRFGGSDDAGISVLSTLYTYSSSQGFERFPYGIQAHQLQGSASACGETIFSTDTVWLPPVESPERLLIRITLPLLLDLRPNFYEEADDIGNLDLRSWQDLWDEYGKFLYVPVRIVFQPDSGRSALVWDNRSPCLRDVAHPVRDLDSSLGSWVKFTPSLHTDRYNQWGWLCYYDPSVGRKQSGVCHGWATNRQAINPHGYLLSTQMENMPAGQYIPYPPAYLGPGTLRVEVHMGGWQVSNARIAALNFGDFALNENEIVDPHGLLRETHDRYRVSWILFKTPEIEVVNNQLADMTISSDDVEYRAEINADAKEELQIDTVCGSKEGGVPMARGAYFYTDGKRQITRLKKNGQTDVLEELLIQGIYSMYGERSVKLSGEIDLPTANSLKAFTEQNQGQKKFIAVSQRQNLIDDASDVTLIQTYTDLYTRSE